MLRPWMSVGPVTKILIANRGEIARRIQRTCRELGVADVAVYSEPDADAPFVREAAEAVALGGVTAAESYLRIDALLAAARQTGADALHPGYGFLAENAELARRCAEAGLTFIGPPPDVIEAMGSKIESKRRLAEVGVPQIPSVTLDGEDESGILARGDAIGFPLLVKASAGGGGKGMRVVAKREKLAAAVGAGRREAERAFGDGTVYLERYLEGVRHVEIQIFGDAHGQVVHLYERDCSIQRRHQKILEESPSPGLDPALRQALCDVAVRAGRAIGYVGAGTVEFVLAPDGAFYFLEVNTRLQVEHPVTECVTGLDLVRLQLELARGAALPAQADLPPLSGHAIEARLYAEDPTKGFLPAAGPIDVFEFDPAPGVRVDSGVESGSVVTPYYDPMLAKVIAWAPTRAEAAERLATALATARLGGRNNRALLVRLLRHPAFLAGEADTRFLERHDPKQLGQPLEDTGVGSG
jgi:acetyl/propionyl-CoA carboxylase alpha subunit